MGTIRTSLCNPPVQRNYKQYRLPDEIHRGGFSSQKPPKRNPPNNATKAALNNAIIPTSNQENI